MKLKITVDGKPYEVDVEIAEEYRNGGGGPAPYYASRSSVSVPAPAPALPPKPGPAAPAAGSKDKVCQSPIAGLVVKVNAHVGQQIKLNDPLLVLEAMKMETNITSPVNGTVKAVNVNAGDPVQAGQVLVEFV